MDIYCPYIRVSTHGHVQNIGQIPQKPFLPISRIWNISTGNIPQKFQENSSMSHMTCLMVFPSIMSWRIVKPHEISPKPFLSILKFEQLYIDKHVPVFSNLVNMLQWFIYSSRPNGTSWRECYLAQSTPKPFLFRTKFEQLYIGNFLLLISTFVDMFITSNDDTTPSGASRRIDLHD